MIYLEYILLSDSLCCCLSCLCGSFSCCFSASLYCCLCGYCTSLSCCYACLSGNCCGSNSALTESCKKLCEGLLLDKEPVDTEAACTGYCYRTGSDSRDCTAADATKCIDGSSLNETTTGTCTSLLTLSLSGGLNSYGPCAEYVTVNCYVLTTNVTNVVCALVVDYVSRSLSLSTTNVTVSISTAAVYVCGNLTGYTTSVTISVTCVVVYVSSSRTSLATTLTGVITAKTEYVTGNLLTNVVTHVTCSVYTVIIYVTNNYTNIGTLVTGCIVTIIEYVEYVSRSIRNLGSGRLYLTTVDTRTVLVNMISNLADCATNITGIITYVVIYMVGYTDCTALVTIGIASIVVYVVAVESKNAHDLLVVVYVACLGNVGNGGIVKICDYEVYKRVVNTCVDE